MERRARSTTSAKRPTVTHFNTSVNVAQAVVRAKSHAFTSSWRLRAFGVDVQRVQGLTGSHKQAVFLGASEGKIGAGFRKMNFADALAIGREHVHSVKPFAGPAGSGPNIAVHIATNAVRRTRRHICKQAPILQPHARFDIIDTNG